MGDINSPLKCNEFSGVNISAETENQQSCPVNTVIEGAFKGPNEVQPVQNNIEDDFAEELCLEKECDSAAEGIKDSSSREFLKDTNQQLKTSRADQDSSRASPSIVKARSPHCWTRKNRPISSVGPITEQNVSGKKRTNVEAECQVEVPSKRIQVSYIDEQSTSLLVEADSQPRQQQ